MIDTLEHLVMLIITVFSLIIALFFSACAQTVQRRPVEYINTPIYCNIKMPEKPKLQDGTQYFTSNFAKVLSYTDELEMALLCCKGDERCFTKNSVDN